MSNDEQKFEQYVKSLRFDDAPSGDHRDKLEQQLLEAYDNQAQDDGGYVEPASVYFRKLALAASFLIVAGVLFWGIDKLFITTDSLAGLPDQEGIRSILKQENATGANRKRLLKQIYDVGISIERQDTDELVTVVNTPTFAYAVRTWAAKWLGKFGNAHTLQTLEARINSMNITDPDDPLVIAAERIRQRLYPQEHHNEQPGMQSLDNGGQEVE